MKATPTEGKATAVYKASNKCQAPRPDFFAGGTEQPKADAAQKAWNQWAPRPHLPGLPFPHLSSGDDKPTS